MVETLDGLCESSQIKKTPMGSNLISRRFTPLTKICILVKQSDESDIFGVSWVANAIFKIDKLKNEPMLSAHRAPERVELKSAWLS